MSPARGGQFSWTLMVDMFHGQVAFIPGNRRSLGVAFWGSFKRECGGGLSALSHGDCDTKIQVDVQ